MRLKLNKDRLFEVGRGDLLRKSRYQSKTRYNKRLNYQVSNFRGVDLKQLFDNDYFVFTTPIGDYMCTIAFPDVFTTLKEVLSQSTHGDIKKVNLQMVIRALSKEYDNADDLKVNCTCPDFYYRFSYVATIGDYKYGEPQTIPAKITNPDNDLGAVCKHLDLLLSNKRWLTKAASAVNAFIKAYPDKASVYLFDKEPEVEDDSEVVNSPLVIDNEEDQEDNG